jgi:hypothetical protein
MCISVCLWCPQGLSLDEGDYTGDIKLVATVDEFTATVDKSCAVISALVKEAMDKDSSMDSLDLAVNKTSLQSIVEFMEYHKGKEPKNPEKPLKSAVMAEVCEDKWDADFIDTLTEKKLQNVYDLVLAANYMNIPSLLHLASAKIASLVRDQPMDKIRSILVESEASSDSKTA